jgi:hypothetical protein
MGTYLFMKPVLQAISSGRFFHRGFAGALRVVAVIVALAGLAGWVAGWKLISKLEATQIVGGVIFQLLFLVAVYMVVHTLLIRARDIADLGESDFTVIPIASILLKLIGEIYACFNVAIAVGGGIFIWFAGSDARYILRDVAPLAPSFGGASFAGGVLFMVGGVLGAFVALVFFYLLSELVVAVVDIAKNVKVTRQIAERYDKSNATA